MITQDAKPIGEYRRYDYVRPYYDVRKIKTPFMKSVTKILVSILGNLQWIEVKEKDLV